MVLLTKYTTTSNQILQYTTPSHQMIQEEFTQKFWIPKEKIENWLLPGSSEADCMFFFDFREACQQLIRHLNWTDAVLFYSGVKGNYGILWKLKRPLITLVQHWRYSYY